MQYVDWQRYVARNLNECPASFDYRQSQERMTPDRWQSDFRAALRAALGLDLIQEMNNGCPPTSRSVARFEWHGFSAEKLYLQSEPGMEIPFYLLLPDNGEQPVPLVICPHGHNRRGKETYIANFESDEEREYALAGDRDIALQAVRAGYAAIAPDVRGFWEMGRREEIESGGHKSCDELQRRALMLGRCLVGERVFDMGRLIDYAGTRSEIDSERIMITGNSGGGTVSLFAAAVDERITVAAPSSYFCTFRDSILAVHHCMCNAVPGIMRLGEMYDVAGLIAPRPLLCINGKDDHIFPIEATRQAFERVREIYADFGVSEKCELFVGDGGHRYYMERVWGFAAQYL